MLTPRTHLDEVSRAMEHLEGLGFSRPLVHLMDREGDSVGHYRRWQSSGDSVVGSYSGQPAVDLSRVGSSQ
ncbi:MAG: hypothetical protein IPL34_12335 [Thiofilum sp.]|uniref:hypothetical protein n=1 Tax=Thiofilum sp. TaxID=2212733 RepID=UPI0025D3D5F9|nr:hypothetical protein [Thiofilum sp.]MBK8454080.1 hypothetical protein [Thiofilum sp.]